MKIFGLVILLSSLFFTACSGAYSSHHGDRSGRYNDMPYRGNYHYNNYYPGSMYIGRPYRRY